MTGATAGDRLRLSPRTILASGVNAAARSALPFAAGAFAMDFSVSIVALVLVAAALVSFLFGWLDWRTTWYRFDDDALLIGSGYVSKQRRSIAYARIQDVDIERGPLHRLFGLAKLRIETGGGGKDEGTLDAVLLADAEPIRQRLRALRGGATVDVDAPTASAVAEEAEVDLLYRIGAGDLLLLGFLNFSLIAFGLVGAAVQQFDFLLPFEIWDPRAWLRRFPGLDPEWLLHLGWTAQLIVGAVLLAGVALVGVAGGMVRTLLREWNFRLERSARGYRRRRGLITLTDVTIPARRIQAWVMTGGLVRDRFGRTGLAARTLGGGGDEDAGDLPVAPIVDRATLVRLAGAFAIPDGALERPSGRGRLAGHILDELLLGLPPLLLLAAVLTWVAAMLPGWTGDEDGARFVGFLPWAFVTLGMMRLVSAVPRWWSSRHATIPGHIVAEHGWWVRRRVILPIAHVQSVERIEGPIGRLTGTRRLKIGIAAPGGAGRLELRFLPAREADRIAKLLLGEAERIDFLDSLRG